MEILTLVFFLSVLHVGKRGPCMRFIFRNVFHPTCPCSQCNTRSDIIVHIRLCFSNAQYQICEQKGLRASVLPDAGLNICASACMSDKPLHGHMCHQVINTDIWRADGLEPTHSLKHCLSTEIEEDVFSPFSYVCLLQMSFEREVDTKQYSRNWKIL